MTSKLAGMVNIVVRQNIVWGNKKRQSEKKKYKIDIKCFFFFIVLHFTNLKLLKEAKIIRTWYNLTVVGFYVAFISADCILIKIISIKYFMIFWVPKIHSHYSFFTHNEMQFRPFTVLFNVLKYFTRHLRSGLWKHNMRNSAFLCWQFKWRKHGILRNSITGNA